MSRFIEGLAVALVLALIAYLGLFFISLQPNPLRWSGAERAVFLVFIGWFYFKAMQAREE